MTASYRLGMKRPDCYSYISTNINETSGSCIIKQVIGGAAVCTAYWPWLQNKTALLYVYNAYVDILREDNNFSIWCHRSHGVVLPLAEGSRPRHYTRCKGCVFEVTFVSSGSAWPHPPNLWDWGQPWTCHSTQPTSSSGLRAKSAPHFQWHIIYMTVPSPRPATNSHPRDRSKVKVKWWLKGHHEVIRIAIMAEVQWSVEDVRPRDPKGLQETDIYCFLYLPQIWQENCALQSKEQIPCNLIILLYCEGPSRTSICSQQKVFV